MPVQSPTSRMIDRILDSGVKPLLADYGYRKSGRAFFLTENGLFKIVQVQSSQWNTPEQAQFTINLLVTFPYFHETYQGQPFPKNPVSALPLVQQRIGGLRPDGKDHWWQLTPESDADAVGREVAGGLSDYGLLFLNRFQSLADLASLLDTEVGLPCIAGNALVYRAVVLSCLGDAGGANRTLQRAKTLYPVSADFLTTLEKRLSS